jgi:acetolactate synthase-1/3 small subunit
MSEITRYTISIYSENNVGLLNRISAIFLKRHIDILSFSTSQSEIPDVFRFVIIVKMTEDRVKKIVQQIEKQVDVIKAFYHTDEETIFQESALYKVKSSYLFEERQIQNIIKESHANIVTVSPEFFVIEKTGFRHETEKLRKDLAPFGLMQFVRSGRISVTKAPMGISEIINKFNHDNNQ